MANGIEQNMFPQQWTSSDLPVLFFKVHIHFFLLCFILQRVRSSAPAHSPHSDTVTWGKKNGKVKVQEFVGSDTDS